MKLSHGRQTARSCLQGYHRQCCGNILPAPPGRVRVLAGADSGAELPLRGSPVPLRAGGHFALTSDMDSEPSTFQLEWWSNDRRGVDTHCRVFVFF